METGCSQCREYGQHICVEWTTRPRRAFPRSSEVVLRSPPPGCPLSRLLMSYLDIDQHRSLAKVVLFFKRRNTASSSEALSVEGYLPSPLECTCST